MSEGKALYLQANFITGEAEQRFAQVLQDSAGHIMGQTVSSYPKAVNWFLSNYADAEVHAEYYTQEHQEHTFQHLMDYTQSNHLQSRADANVVAPGFAAAGREAGSF